MPAEWEEHEGTWLQWPHDNTFPDHQMRLEHIWLAMARSLHEHEVVHAVLEHLGHARQVRDDVFGHGRIAAHDDDLGLRVPLGELANRLATFQGTLTGDHTRVDEA